MFTFNTIAAVAALLSSASALPAINIDPEVIVPTLANSQPELGSSWVPKTAIVEKRGPTDTYGDYTGQTSKYEDGSGTYVRTDDVHRYGGPGGDKCWTDLFYVSSSYKQTDWNKEASIDCGTTSECEAGIDAGVQTCNEWSIAVSAGAEFNILKDILSVSASVTTSYGESKCDTITTKSTCKWSDNQCHAIWSSQTVKVNHGYIRRRCDFHDGKGDRTVWSKDWDVSEKADALHLGCKASCADGQYTP